MSHFHIPMNMKVSKFFPGTFFRKQEIQTLGKNSFHASMTGFEYGARIHDFYFFQFLTWFCRFSTSLPIIMCYNWHFSFVRSEKRPVINKLKNKSV